MLIIFSGLPGSGKSTIAQALAKQLNAFYLRIDTIEQAILKAKKMTVKLALLVILSLTHSPRIICNWEQQ